MKRKPKIAGIGEILWDILPEGARLGGAPANFAYHCHQLDGESYPVSRVGDDELGHQARAALDQLGVDTNYLQMNAPQPTGQVQVSLDSAGKPRYEILEDVAWDHLEFKSELQILATSLDAACFGVLAQRSRVSRETIYSILHQMPERSIKILDVNLREPFFSRDRVEQSLKLATILKLSDEELPILSDYFGIEGNVTDRLAAIRKHFALNLVAYTRGPDGSILLTGGEIDEFQGVEITAVDSVGAGDSFTAALCMGLLAGWPLGCINKFANEVAAFVCSQKGATPKLPADLLLASIRSSA